MNAADLVGWLATAVGAALGMPQMIRLVRTRHVEGLSVAAWQAVVTMNVAWAAHGIRIDQPPQLVTNVLAFATSLPIVLMLARAHGVPAWRVLAAPLAAAAVLIGLDVGVGSAAFGIAATVPGVVATGAQAAELIRAPSISGVSPLFLVLATVNQGLWTTFAVLIADSGSLIAAAAIGLMVTFNLTWWVLRATGLVRPRPRVDGSVEPAAVVELGR